MKTMRLSHPPGIGNLALHDVEERSPGPGEIKVRVKAASLNFRDGLVVNGFFPTADGMIPLSDGAGEIVELGEGVEGFSVGEKVVSLFHPNWTDGHIDRAELNNTPGGPADGFACEFATRPATHFTRAPSNLSLVEAATLTCAGVTAWRAVVTDGKVMPGATVVTIGTGGVSLFALQFAKAAGATVIALSSSKAKLDKLKLMGADHLINYRETEDWGQAVLDLTGGLGADHIIEVGGPNTMGQSTLAARTGGHIGIIGAVAGFDIDTMPFAIVQAKRLRLQAVTVGSRRDQQNMVRAIEANAIKPVIDRTFPLEDLADAFSDQLAGNLFGKICVEI